MWAIWISRALSRFVSQTKNCFFIQWFWIVHLKSFTGISRVLSTCENSNLMDRWDCRAIWVARGKWIWDFMPMASRRFNSIWKCCCCCNRLGFSNTIWVEENHTCRWNTHSSSVIPDTHYNCFFFHICFVWKHWIHEKKCGTIIKWLRAEIPSSRFYNIPTNIFSRISHGCIL